MKLNEILEEKFRLFSVNDFIRPVYYNFPIALRFEIGIGNVWLNENPYEDKNLVLNNDYCKIANQRALKIYSSVFEPSDDILLVFDCNPDKRLKISLSEISIKQRIRVVQPLNEVDGDDCPYSYYRYLYKLKASKLPAKILLNNIITAELGGESRYSGSVFIYNLNSDLLFSIYDDRGADLIATEKETLKPIYTKLNGMLLKYDREQMDKVFSVK